MENQFSSAQIFRRMLEENPDDFRVVGNYEDGTMYHIQHIKSHVRINIDASGTSLRTVVSEVETDLNYADDDTLIRLVNLALKHIADKHTLSLIVKDRKLIDVLMTHYEK